MANDFALPAVTAVREWTGDNQWPRMRPLVEPRSAVEEAAQVWGIDLAAPVRISADEMAEIATWMAEHGIGMLPDEDS